MKFSIKKQTLLNTLQLLSKVTPTRSTLPIINCALLTVKEGVLNIRATDLEISISINCETEEMEEKKKAIAQNNAAWAGFAVGIAAASAAASPSNVCDCCTRKKETAPGSGFHDCRSHQFVNRF